MADMTAIERHTRRMDRHRAKVGARRRQLEGELAELVTKADHGLITHHEFGEAVHELAARIIPQDVWDRIGARMARRIAGEAETRAAGGHEAEKRPEVAETGRRPLCGQK